MPSCHVYILREAHIQSAYDLKGKYSRHGEMKGLKAERNL